MSALAAPCHELQGESNCILNVAPSDYRDYIDTVYRSKVVIGVDVNISTVQPPPLTAVRAGL